MDVIADILSLWTTIYKENTLKLHGNVGAFIFYTLTARGIDLQTAIVSWMTSVVLSLSRISKIDKIWNINCPKVYIYIVQNYSRELVHKCTCFIHISTDFSRVNKRFPLQTFRKREYRDNKERR